MNIHRVIMLATLLAVGPVLFVTLQTLRAAWSQEPSESGPDIISVNEEVKIDEIKAELAGGPDAFRTRSQQAVRLPVTEVFTSGFIAPSLKIPASADGPDKAWDELNGALGRFAEQRKAFETCEKHVGRQQISLLSERQLSEFASDLTPVAAAVPSLRNWPQRLQEMGRDRKATQHFLDKLNDISGELREYVNGAGDTLVQIPETDWKRWNQQLSDLGRAKVGDTTIDSFPTIVDQYAELKRRVDFWVSWNPPAAPSSGKTSATILSARRAALLQLQKKARTSRDGAARLPEEMEHVGRVAAEIERLAGEVLYQALIENTPKSMPDLLTRMQPIIEAGAHREDLAGVFKAAVEQGLSLKTTRQTKLPLYDFAMYDGTIWLAHSDRKADVQGGIWITSYDLEKDDKVTFVSEHLLHYANPSTGYTKISEPEEVRIVAAYNGARSGLLNNLGEIDSWKALQSQLKEQEKQLAAYYRKMKQFREPSRVETGRHHLAPELNFVADQKLIDDVLEQWSIVESLYSR